MVRLAAGAVAAYALSLAFPLHDLPWIAPFALAVIFWTWRERSATAAAGLAFIEGTIFYAVVDAWFTQTIGARVGHFAIALDLGNAMLSAWSWALAAALAVVCRRRVRPGFAPAAIALVFTLCEYLRLQGPLADPFGTLAEPFVATPLAALATVGGATFITFALALTAAYLVDALASRAARSLSAIVLGGTALACVLAWLAWPARMHGHAGTPVAVVQGNVSQAVKWSPATLSRAAERYVTMTQAIRTHPAFVLWPETVITTYLSQDPDLRSRFAELAQTMQTTVIVGTDDLSDGRAYNALWYFDASGDETIYHKERLVPFAEYLPARRLFGALPISRMVSTFSPGTGDGIFDAGGVTTGALVCYESGFADLAATRVAAGAQVLLVATDDGWFGTSAGPYQHAQIASLRAIELGRWVVRARPQPVSRASSRPTAAISSASSSTNAAFSSGTSVNRYRPSSRGSVRAGSRCSWRRRFCWCSSRQAPQNEIVATIVSA